MIIEGHEIIFVQWVDSSVYEFGTYAALNDPDFALTTMTTVGLLIGETDELVAIAVDHSDGRLHEHYRQISIIPKCAIRREQRVQLSFGPPLPE